MADTGRYVEKRWVVDRSVAMPQTRGFYAGEVASYRPAVPLVEAGDPYQFTLRKFGLVMLATAILSGWLGVRNAEQRNYQAFLNDEAEYCETLTPGGREAYGWCN